MLYLFAAPVLAVALMLILMPGCIKELRKLKFGQTMYELGPQTHLNKKGTPNMGGLVIGLVTVVVTVLFAALNYSRLAKNGGELAHWWTLDNGLWGLLFVALGAMTIGFTDDYTKDVKKNHEGLKPMQKVAGQLVVGLVFSIWAYFYVGSDVILPFTGKTWNLGIFYIPLITLTVLFMTNSANLQDGLDGLLSSVTVVGMIAFGVLAVLMGRLTGAKALLGETSRDAVAILCFTLAGAAIGFLRFNHYPAQIFMGDTGSMFIGGVMVGAAVVLKCEFLLLLICFTCVMSSVSVMLQTAYFKYTKKKTGTGKRIFKMSPIHHHFEMCGMKETQIVAMYAVVTLALAALAILSAVKWFA